MKAIESKSMVLLHHHLKALRLPTIGAECEKVARRAASDGSDHLTYLLEVTELELLERRSAERRLKDARFPGLKSLESFDFTTRASVNKVLIAELARCEFIERRENVLLVGNPGIGKSHLAIGIAAAACARGYRVRFFRVTELVTSLIEARDERTLLGLRARLAKVDLLVAR
jgi:DNA replication protein DnaC